MKRLLAPIFIAIACSFNALATPPDSVMAPVFIILGQSNADGSAMFDPDEDARLRQWYTSPANTGDMKIWYRSTKVFNQPVNALGEAARWVVDGDTTDMQPGWMNLWYRNENLSGRTAMNMIHGYGTYSTGTGTDCAQGRRGIEGQFGMKFRQAFPDDDLYIIKLGVSGSFISSWAHPDDNTNWDYFYRHIYRPAIEDLLAKGKRPYLAGIWWMQGCADMYNTKTYYYTLLQNLIMKCRTELGFPMGRFYIGHIVKPGESELYPHGSMSFSQDLRDAQDSVAATTPHVDIIDTKDCELQYEPYFSGYVHFSHKGVNAIADTLVAKITADPRWEPFSTPGQWVNHNGQIIFSPEIGSPEISYTSTPDGSAIEATLSYPGWSERISHHITGLEPKLPRPE